LLLLARHHRSAFLGYELLYRLLAAALFTPLVAWTSARLIALSGSGAVSNYDLAGFLLSPTGLLFLTTVATLGFALSFFEFGGLFALAIAGERDTRVRLPQLFRFLAFSLPGLLRLALRQFLGYAIIAAPCLAVTGAAYLAFLTRSDIYYYLEAKPPAFWAAVAIATLSALAFAWFAGRRFLDWIFAIPLLLFSPAGPRAALRESTRLARPRRRELLGLLLRWLAFAAALYLAFALLMGLLKWALLGLAGERVGLVLALTAALAVLQFLGAALVGMVASAALALAITRRYLELGPAPRLPERLTATDPDRLSRALRWLGTGWVAVLLFAALTGYAAIRIMNTTEGEESVGVTAHRGSSIAAPENSMDAILLAVEEGADYIEIDVQETRDGTVVLAHDKDLKRVWGLDKGIWEIDYEELVKLDSGSWFAPEFSHLRVATLDEVIEAVKGRAKLNIELKFNGHQQQLAKEVVRIVREHEFGDQCILTSLDFAGIERVRAAGPELRTGVIVTSSIGDITRLGGELLSVSAKAATRDLIDRARRAGLEVHVWTVNEVPLMNTMIGMGVDQIITDDPKLLREVIEERAKLTPVERKLLRLADLAERRL